MKLAALSFDTPRRGGAVPIAAPPSGAPERGIWKLRGRVVRSPACFPRSALTTEPRIKLIIELRSHPAPTESIWISAKPIKGSSDALGPIKPITIRPERWVGSAVKVGHTFDASRLRNPGVGRERVAWQWYWGYEGSAAARRLARSEHVLFVTIKRPIEPWSDDAVAVGFETTPWITALELACEWGRGAKTERQAAERVVKSFFALGLPRRGKNVRFRYNPARGIYLEPGMANPRFFELESFLADVAIENPSEPININCLEAATVTATFANLLGCSLDPCVIESPSCLENFQLNRTRQLGHSDDPFREFRLHVVAADRGRRANLGDARIYDSTMKIDSDTQPACGPHTFVFAAGMLLGSKNSPVGTAKYFPQLIAEDFIHGCSARRIGHAMVREPDKQDEVDVCPLARFVRHLQELLLAKTPPVTRIPVPMTPDISGYDIHPIYYRRPGIPRVGLPKMPERTRHLYKGTTAGRAIQLDQWTDPNPLVNLIFMAELLASSELVPEAMAAGEPIYAIGGDRTIVAYLQGAVVQLASVGASDVNMREIFSRMFLPPLGPAAPVAVRSSKPTASPRRKR